MNDPLRVLIADDHAVMRQGLRALLADSGEIDVVGEAATGREAVEQAASLQPDAVVMDLTMPELNGIEATREIRRKCASTCVVMLSMHADSEYVYRAFEAGASGYLLKDSPFDEIVAALRAAVAGRRYTGSGIVAPPEPGERGRRASPLDSLSTRERQVLQLVAEGRTSAEIAVEANLSPKSVDTYRSRVMKKIGVSDTVGLVKFAIQHGLAGTR